MAPLLFSGTQEKCAACHKTVYPVDELSADGVAYHKPCFRCHHCNRILQLGEYSSLAGVPFCKPHLEQLFKLTGNFDKLGFGCVNLAQPKMDTNTQMPKALKKVLSCLYGTQDICISCGQKVYPLDKVSVEGLLYHKTCFRCIHGGCFINTSNYAALQGRLYCKHHFSQLFKEKGDYRQLEKIPSRKPITYL